jgi:hypothetical protein
MTARAGAPRAGAFALAAALLACQGPSVTLEVLFPDGTADLELVVTASLYAPGAQSGVGCEGVAFGDFDEGDLQASLVGSAELAGSSGDIGEVPRRGRKLVVVKAFDGDERMRLAGCAELATDVTGPTRVQVQLEHALQLDRVELDADSAAGAPVSPLPDALAAEVRAGAQAQAVPELLLHASIAGGAAPPVHSQVRLRVIGPDGSDRNADPSGRLPVVLLDDGGKARVRVAIDQAGPFAVELTPRFAPEAPGSTLLRGFATPARREVSPMPLDRLRWLVPLRLGARGAGFAGLRQDTGFTLYLAVAHHDGSAPSFELHQTDATLLTPVGRVYLPDVEQAALVAQSLAAPRDHPVLRVLSPGSGDSVDGRSLSWTPQDSAEAELVVTALPVGPCDGRAAPGGDVDAAPLLISLYGGPVGARYLRLLLASLDDRWSPDLLAGCALEGNVVGVASHCASDELGVPHRLLELQGVDDEGATVRNVLDLGSGVLDSEVGLPLAALCARIDSAPSVELQAVQVLGPGRSREGSARLLSSSVVGLGLALEVLRVDSTGQKVLVREELLLGGLQAPAELLRGGAFGAAGLRDLASLIVQRDRDTGLPRATVLSLLTEGGTWSGGALYGGVAVAPCRQLDTALGSLAQLCWAESRDLDGDGRDELLLVVDEGRAGQSQFRPLLLNFGSP